MNSKIKWLEKKWVIQMFGAGLFLSPFVNLFMMFSLIQKQTQLPWGQLPFRQILVQGQPVKYALALGSLAIGIIMLRGSPRAWHYVMGLLTGYILSQIPTIGYDMRVNWVWGPVFLMNCGLLFFIADQLVFKNSDFSFKKGLIPEKDQVQPSFKTVTAADHPVQKIKKIEPPKKVVQKPALSLQPVKPKPKTFRRAVSKTYQLDFMNEGVVGEVFDLNDEGFKLRLKKPVSASVHNKNIEVSFDRVHYKIARVDFITESAVIFKFHLHLDNKRQAV